MRRQRQGGGPSDGGMTHAEFMAQYYQAKETVKVAQVAHTQPLFESMLRQQMKRPPPFPKSNYTTESLVYQSRMALPNHGEYNISCKDEFERVVVRKPYVLVAQPDGSTAQEDPLDALRIVQPPAASPVRSQPHSRGSRGSNVSTMDVLPPEERRVEDRGALGDDEAEEVESDDDLRYEDERFEDLPTEEVMEELAASPTKLQSPWAAAREAAGRPAAAAVAEVAVPPLQLPRSLFAAEEVSGGESDREDRQQEEQAPRPRPPAQARPKPKPKAKPKRQPPPPPRAPPPRQQQQQQRQRQRRQPRRKQSAATRRRKFLERRRAEMARYVPTFLRRQRQAQAQAQTQAHNIGQQRPRLPRPMRMPARGRVRRPKALHLRRPRLARKRSPQRSPQKQRQRQTPKKRMPFANMRARIARQVALRRRAADQEARRERREAEERRRRAAERRQREWQRWYTIQEKRRQRKRRKVREMFLRRQRRQRERAWKRAQRERGPPVWSPTVPSDAHWEPAPVVPRSPAPGSGGSPTVRRSPVRRRSPAPAPSPSPTKKRQGRAPRVAAGVLGGLRNQARAAARSVVGSPIRRLLGRKKKKAGVAVWR